MKLLFFAFDRFRNLGMNALPPIIPGLAFPSRAPGTDATTDTP